MQEASEPNSVRAQTRSGERSALKICTLAAVRHFNVKSQPEQSVELFDGLLQFRPELPIPMPVRQMPSMKNVLVIERIAPSATALLDARPDISWKLVSDTSPSSLLEAVRDADAITIRVAELPVHVLEAAPGLKVVSRHGVGYDNVPVDYCTGRGIAVAIVGNANSVSVAEHAIYLMLAAAKKGVMADSAVRSGEFSSRAELVGVELKGRTLLVVGCGRIGSELIPRAQAFGIRTLVYDPFFSGNLDPRTNIIRNLDDGLAQAEILSLHLPLTPETRMLIGERELRMLPKGAIVVNASRGGLIDEGALLDSIRAGHVFAAGLDTFETEPLPKNSPLTGEPRIVLSPHSAALTKESLRAMAELTVRNALDGLDGKLKKELVVNPEVLG